MSNEALSQEQIKWAYQKRCERYTYYEIADALYLDPKTLHRTLKRHGYETKRPRQFLEYKG